MSHNKPTIICREFAGKPTINGANQMTRTEFQRFREDYYNHKFYNERFGQAFCNFFDIQDSKLFYEENEKRAFINATAYIHDWNK